VTEHEHAELMAVLSDLLDEEADQQAERGHASGRLLRAVARLNRVLEGGDGEAEESAVHPGEQG
jgi:hypothetical protein